MAFNSRFLDSGLISPRGLSPPLDLDESDGRSSETDGAPVERFDVLEERLQKMAQLFEKTLHLREMLKGQSQTVHESNPDLQTPSLLPPSSGIGGFAQPGPSDVRARPALVASAAPPREPRAAARHGDLLPDAGPGPDSSHLARVRLAPDLQGDVDVRAAAPRYINQAAVLAAGAGGSAARPPEDMVHRGELVGTEPTGRHEAQFPPSADWRGREVDITNQFATVSTWPDPDSTWAGPVKDKAAGAAEAVDSKDGIVAEMAVVETVLNEEMEAQHRAAALRHVYAQVSACTPCP